ncbi:MAG: cytochrome [Actinomycetia bacterium]|nr:cytochrome [Actinomycetes bacterium]
MAQPTVFEEIIDYANRADPWPLYRELRKTPVTREPDGTYVVTRYRDIVALLHDPRTSSRLTTSTTTFGIIGQDPPEHDRARQILMRHYGPPETPGRIESLRTGIRDIATGLIERFGPDRADLVDEFAYPLPVTVICQLLGVPVEDEPRFRVWADTIIENIVILGTEPDEVVRKREDAIAQMSRYLGTLADARRVAPGDDLLSALVADERTWDGMSHKELDSNAALLLLAGHETTVNLIANGMLTLLRHPGLLSRLRADPGFAVPVVEELLRYEPPVHFLRRMALDKIDVAGVTIPAGATMRLAVAAGSRDPEHVHDPDKFNPDRHDSAAVGVRLQREGQHLGFGGGIHYCFGAPLARLEAQVALTELGRRLDNPRLAADPPPYRPSLVLRGPRHLPIEFDRVAPA